ncbi:hypothetical protein FRC12_006896 [Ceratobasidium sp. 428]|nr:hypothetical protein FRC12_006896 [Ceratobasidium sp. 428]
MCSASKQFDNVDQTQVCLSTDCAKQKGHSVTESIHNLATKCDVIVGENQPTLQDPEIRLQHLKYFASLDANDLLELADHFKIPRQKVEPHVKAMLSIFHFMANELLE